MLATIFQPVAWAAGRLREQKYSTSVTMWAVNRAPKIRIAARCMTIYLIITHFDILVTKLVFS
jgi:hypothetical protein